ncbi:unnamed protein product [Brachionus calyciflorus]|uniref:Chitin-binding type-2 domain-containing protein n=1 Tax=Brachionus calyciflorus TaxID=104777 RepID=A0A813S7S2_9BILA|nr:unnamed protein product [Brachionus calyciflorus]
MNSKNKPVRTDEIKLKIPPAFVPDQWVCNHSKKRKTEKIQEKPKKLIKRKRRIHPQVSLSYDLMGKNFPKPLNKNTNSFAKKLPLISMEEFNKRMNKKFERIRLTRRKKIQSEYSKALLLPEYELVKGSLPKKKPKLFKPKIKKSNFRVKKSFSKKKFRPFKLRKSNILRKNIQKFKRFSGKRFTSFIRRNKILASRKKIFRPFKKYSDYDILSEDNYQTIDSCSTQPNKSAVYESSFLSDNGFNETPSIEIVGRSSVENSKKSSTTTVESLKTTLNKIKSNSEKLQSRSNIEYRKIRSHGDQPLPLSKIEYAKPKSQEATKNSIPSKVNLKINLLNLESSETYNNHTNNSNFNQSNVCESFNLISSNYTSQASFTNVTQNFSKANTSSISKSSAHIKNEKKNLKFKNYKIKRRHSISVPYEYFSHNTFLTESNTRSLINKHFSGFTVSEINESNKKSNKSKILQKDFINSKSTSIIQKLDTNNNYKLKSLSDTNLCIKKKKNSSMTDKIRNWTNAKIASESINSDQEDLMEIIPDSDWIDSGKTKLGLQLDRLIRRYKKLSRQKRYLVFFIIVLLFFTTLSFLTIFVLLILGPTSQYIIIKTIDPNSTKPTTLFTFASPISTTSNDFISTTSSSMMTTTITTTTKSPGLVGDTCLKVFGDCSNYMECKRQDTLAWNISTCQCKAGYIVDLKRTCKGLSESYCENNSECSKHLVCNLSEKKCVCKDGYSPKPDGTCFAKFNTTCEVDSDCLKNGECKTIGLEGDRNEIKVCKCSSKDRTIFNPEFEPYRQCRLLIGARCQENLDCIENAKCNKYCTCRETDLFFETENFQCEDACKNITENFTFNGIVRKFSHPRKCGHYFTCSPRSLDWCPSNYVFNYKSQSCDSTSLCR